jgi:hypothetical protein
MRVVGWYHSHPSFPALPSIIDIDNQLQVSGRARECVQRVLARCQVGAGMAQGGIPDTNTHHLNVHKHRCSVPRASMRAA